MYMDINHNVYLTTYLTLPTLASSNEPVTGAFHRTTKAPSVEPGSSSIPRAFKKPSHSRLTTWVTKYLAG
jgi:hypothetical protein